MWGVNASLAGASDKDSPLLSGEEKSYPATSMSPPRRKPDALNEEKASEMIRTNPTGVAEAWPEMRSSSNRLSPEDGYRSVQIPVRFNYHGGTGDALRPPNSEVRDLRNAFALEKLDASTADASLERKLFATTADPPDVFTTQPDSQSSNLNEKGKMRRMLPDKEAEFEALKAHHAQVLLQGEKLSTRLNAAKAQVASSAVRVLDTLTDILADGPASPFRSTLERLRRTPDCVEDALTELQEVMQLGAATMLTMHEDMKEAQGKLAQHREEDQNRMLQDVIHSEMIQVELRGELQASRAAHESERSLHLDAERARDEAQAELRAAQERLTRESFERVGVGDALLAELAAANNACSVQTAEARAASIKWETAQQQLTAQRELQAELAAARGELERAQAARQEDSMFQEAKADAVTKERDEARSELSRVWTQLTESPMAMPLSVAELGREMMETAVDLRREVIERRRAQIDLCSQHVTAKSDMALLQEQLEAEQNARAADRGRWEEARQQLAETDAKLQQECMTSADVEKARRQLAETEAKLQQQCKESAAAVRGGDSARAELATLVLAMQEDRAALCEAMVAESSEAQSEMVKLWESLCEEKSKHKAAAELAEAERLEKVKLQVALEEERAKGERTARQVDSRDSAVGKLTEDLQCMEVQFRMEHEKARMMEEKIKKQENIIEKLTNDVQVKEVQRKADNEKRYLMQDQVAEVVDAAAADIDELRRVHDERLEMEHFIMAARQYQRRWLRLSFDCWYWLLRSAAVHLRLLARHIRRWQLHIVANILQRWGGWICATKVCLSRAEVLRQDLWAARVAAALLEWAQHAAFELARRCGLLRLLERRELRLKVEVVRMWVVKMVAQRRAMHQMRHVVFSRAAWVVTQWRQRVKTKAASKKSGWRNGRLMKRVLLRQVYMRWKHMANITQRGCKIAMEQWLQRRDRLWRLVLKGWSRFTVLQKRYQKMLKRAVSKRQNTAVENVRRKWQARVHLVKLSKKCVLLGKHRLEGMALLQWEEYARQEVMQGNKWRQSVGAKVVRRMAHGVVGRCLLTWAELAQTQRQQRVLMTRLAQRWKGATMQDVVAEWAHLAGAAKQHAVVLQRALQRMQNGSVAGAWDTWREWVRFVKVTRRCVLVGKHRLEGMALLQWEEYARQEVMQGNKWRQSVGAKVVGRMVHGVVGRCLLTWAELAQTQRRQRVLTTRLAQRWKGATMQDVVAEWAHLAGASKQHAVVVRRALQRMQNGSVAGAWDTWREWVCFVKVTRRCVLLGKHRLEGMALLQWEEYARQEVMQGNKWRQSVGAKVVRRMVHGVVGRCLLTWAELAQTQRRQRVLTTRLAQRWKGATMQDVVAEWAHLAGASKQHAVVVRRALQRMQNGSVAGAWDTWREWVRFVKVTRRCVLVGKHRLEGMALLQWEEYARQEVMQGNKWRQSVGAKVVRRMAHGVVGRCLLTWAELAQTQRQQRVLMTRLAQRWKGATMQDVVAEWAHLAGAAKQHAVVLQRALQRMQNGSVAGAWDTWREWVRGEALLQWEEYARQFAKVARRCVLVGKHRLEGMALLQWEEYARQKQNGSVARAWDTWREWVRFVKVTRRCVLLGKHRLEGMALLQWAEYARQEVMQGNKWRQSVGARVVRRMVQGVVGRCLLTWAELAQTQRQQRVSTTRLAQRWKGAAMQDVVAEWAHLAGASKQHAVVVRRALQRMQNGSVAGAWDTWREWVWRMKVTRRCVLLGKHRLEGMALLQWEEYARQDVVAEWAHLAGASKQHAVVVRRALQRMQNGSVAGAWDTWREWVCFVKVTRRCVLLGKHRLEGMALLQWEEYARQEVMQGNKWRQSVGAKVVRRMVHGVVGRCLLTWAELAQTQRQQRKGVMRMAQRCKGATMQNVVAEWAHLAGAAKQHAVVVRRALQRMQNGSVAGAWDTWREWVRFVKVTQRCVLLGKHRLEGMALLQWEEYARQVRAMKQILQKAERMVGRNAHGLLRWCLLTWAELAQTQRQQGVGVMRMAQRWKGATMQDVMAEWAHLAGAAKQHAVVVRRALQRMQNGSVAGAWDTWREWVRFLTVTRRSVLVGKHRLEGMALLQWEEYARQEVMQRSKLHLSVCAKINWLMAHGVWYKITQVPLSKKDYNYLIEYVRETKNCFV
ncbi:hypothetical protein CYMTET_37915 [Cymbomonas tetramitiformis]|uniref:Uncharacterized protein n=1 Tax=Cymbomonas tetramitiformis TaxID=36881 RepID=A0AAE0CEJ7_9CHLO|nr:hypothetical protein CYMTET_37915 [Cymbomonas tetramitiformis]